jgi:hypothetical protein
MGTPNRFFFIMISLIALCSGCGVKGVPLPPLTPPPLGRGERTYSDTDSSSGKKAGAKKNSERQSFDTGEDNQ